MSVSTIKKILGSAPTQETPKPDFRNLKNTTSKDSTDYKKGFSDAVEGKNRLFPNKSRVKGYREAEERGVDKKK